MSQREQFPAGSRPRDRLRPHAPDRNAGETLSALTGRLDALARDLDWRGGRITEDDLAEARHCLGALARRIDVRAARASEIDHDGLRLQFPPSREFDEPHGLHRFRQDDCIDPPTIILDRRQSEALSAGLAAVKALLNARPAQPRGLGRMLHHRIDIAGDRNEATSLDRDRRYTVVAPDPMSAGADRRQEQPEPDDDRPAPPSHDPAAPLFLPQIHPSQRAPVLDNEPKRSRLKPSARAALAAALAVTLVVTGAHFLYPRATSAFVTTPAMAFFQKSASFLGGGADAQSGKDVPRRILAQDVSLPMPEVYGVYAVNNGQLVELDALPGQAPDQRVSMSGAILKPSRVTLPPGRIVFVVFRRDMASSVSERVPIRVVAKVRRAMKFGPAGEPRNAEMDDTWTIRNIAFDYRVAPLEHSREMVLVRPESLDFTLPSGRYALILKGQAYDFTIDGPITEPAQCLERVEAANGNFYHECQQPEAGSAEAPAPAPPPSVRASPKTRRQATAADHAKTVDLR